MKISIYNIKNKKRPIIQTLGLLTQKMLNRNLYGESAIIEKNKSVISNPLIEIDRNRLLKQKWIRRLEKLQVVAP